jgi:hypothetical protein
MKSLQMKIDELSKIGIFKQYTLNERLEIYYTYPVEFQEDAIKEAREYSEKGFVCNEFTLIDGRIESVIQWQKPSTFIKNCYQWFVINA